MRLLPGSPRATRDACHTSHQLGFTSLAFVRLQATERGACGIWGGNVTLQIDRVTCGRCLVVVRADVAHALRQAAELSRALAGPKDSGVPPASR